LLQSFAKDTKGIWRNSQNGRYKDASTRLGLMRLGVEERETGLENISWTWAHSRL
jgi:hypothetical protein